MLQHGRPGNRPDKHYISLGYSSPLLPLHHLSPTGSPAAFLTHALFLQHILRHLKTPLLSDLCVCLHALNPGVSSLHGWDPPPSVNRYSSPHHNWAGGPHKLALNMLSFFAGLMSANIKKGRKNVWQGGKRWNHSSKQPQRIYLTEGERQARGVETRDERRSGWEYKYVHMKPHYSHVSSHYLLISSPAGCCLPVMTSILQISSCSQT